MFLLLNNYTWSDETNWIPDDHWNLDISKSLGVWFVLWHNCQALTLVLSERCLEGHEVPHTRTWTPIYQADRKSVRSICIPAHTMAVFQEASRLENMKSTSPLGQSGVAARPYKSPYKLHSYIKRFQAKPCLLESLALYTDLDNTLHCRAVQIFNSGKVGRL